MLPDSLDADNYYGRLARANFFDTFKESSALTSQRGFQMKLRGTAYTSAMERMAQLHAAEAAAEAVGDLTEARARERASE